MTTGVPRDFKNKTVLITGGGSGVGLECARLFTRDGANILITGRNADKLEAALAQIDTDAKTALAGDVTDSAHAEATIAHARSTFGTPVHVLINNAGTILRREAKDTTDADWQQVIDINVNGVFFMSRTFAHQDIADGAIINLSSTCGQVGAAGLAAYCASKGAVDQLTRTMALELAPRKINVNAVAPGAINSPMLFSKHDDQKMAETVVERNLETIPIGTIAQPEEVARAILFLARERHITGTILSVDGGYTSL